MPGKKNLILLFVPVLICGILALLSLFDLTKFPDNMIFNAFSLIKPAVSEENSILIFDIDENTRQKAGSRPLNRSVFADALLMLKEWDAQYVMLDLDLSEPGRLDLKTEIIEQNIPDIFFKDYISVRTKINEQMAYLKDRYLPLVYRNINNLKLKDLANNNDDILSEAIHLFDQCYVPLSPLPQEDAVISVKAKQEFLGKTGLQIDAKEKLSRALIGLKFPTELFLPKIKKSGFLTGGNTVNYHEIDLIGKYKDTAVPHIAFALALDILENPEVMVLPQAIVLRNAVLPGKKPKDLLIPLTENGSFLINWPPENIGERFRHRSFYDFIELKSLESNLVHNLQIMEKFNFSFLYPESRTLLSLYAEIERLHEDLLDSSRQSSFAVYKGKRTLFFQSMDRFLKGDAQKIILDNSRSILPANETPATFKTTVQELFKTEGELYQKWAQTHSSLEEMASGSLCFIGPDKPLNTDNQYTGTQVSAAGVNTILSEEFLDDCPWWFAAIASLIIILSMALMTRVLNPLPSFFIGLFFLCIVIAGGLSFFIATGIYFGLANTIAAHLLSLAFIIIYKLQKKSREKTILRKSFDSYVSEEVMDELLRNSEKISFSGDKKYITAMYTEIKAFSYIQERLDPKDLVTLLNQYLSELSSTILNLKGTIDQYDRDAIACFFGAPNDLEDHSYRACQAAILIKKMEQKLNKHFINRNLSPAPLFTRIGINTADMAVGNFGSNFKMNYTLAGFGSDLARKLKKLNRQYGSWILISEHTYNEGGREFSVRRLDKVRLDNSKRILQLYELIDDKSTTEPYVKEGIEIFHRALREFEKQEWRNALNLFKKVYTRIPRDNPTGIYIKRCRDFLKHPPKVSWDGVFNLNLK
ncbi:MAG: CHASE2 domain-containing protein [Spirochaetales bacterium]|nr:CHASE2 domain-containing protein [Spirochaetales bacterium]